MTDRFPNRRWIFLTSGDIATKVNFNNVMEGSPETCRYNIAPPSESGTKSFVKYEVVEYPQDNWPEITIYSGFHQEPFSGTSGGAATWQEQYNVPLQAVQSGTYDTYQYTYEVTGSGANLEWDYLTGSGGNITGEAITGTGYYPLYADNILSSGLFAPSGTITGRPPCYEYALDVEYSGVTQKEFKHQEMLDILSGPDWSQTGFLS
tara:strand:- start:62 stop:679 length:618 start_codon:yes stop_codon:yes gene_type:complete